MGALADAIVAYAQPLLDQSDGTEEGMQKAFTMSNLCYNLALLPEHERETTLSEMRASLQMDDAQFEDFQQSFILPMIRRHKEMFPRLHQRNSTGISASDIVQRDEPITRASSEAYPGTDRYAPCPCNSGEKYKFCCGAKGRKKAT